MIRKGFSDATADEIREIIDLVDRKRVLPEVSSLLLQWAQGQDIWLAPGDVIRYLVNEPDRKTGR